LPEQGEGLNITGGFVIHFILSRSVSYQFNVSIPSIRGFDFARDPGSYDGGIMVYQSGFIDERQDIYDEDVR
jgi:hypothetical protein